MAGTPVLGASGDTRKYRAGGAVPQSAAGRPGELAMAEVYFEFQQIGAYVKVTAIDPDTLVEVSVTGAASAGQQSLKQLALRRLQFVLAKRREGGSRGGNPSGGTLA